MCGRYALSKLPAELIEEFEIHTGKTLDTLKILPADWNIAPTKEIYIIKANHEQQRELATASWGLIAPWSKSIPDAVKSQSIAINARTESVDVKPTFKSAFISRRCLIPADGYYEWATALGKYKPKQPFYISSDDGKPLAMAGIWNTWRSPSGVNIQSASVITREAVGELATIHSRMPVMMPRDHWDEWLDVNEHSTQELIEMMKHPFPDAHLHPVPVSDAVTKVVNNGPELAIPISISEPETLF